MNSRSVTFMIEGRRWSTWLLRPDVFGAPDVASSEIDDYMALTAALRRAREHHRPIMVNGERRFVAHVGALTPVDNGLEFEVRTVQAGDPKPAPVNPRGVAAFVTVLVRLRQRIAEVAPEARIDEEEREGTPHVRVVLPEHTPLARIDDVRSKLRGWPREVALFVTAADRCNEPDQNHRACMRLSGHGGLRDALDRWDAGAYAFVTAKEARERLGLPPLFADSLAGIASAAKRFDDALREADREIARTLAPGKGRRIAPVLGLPFDVTTRTTKERLLGALGGGGRLYALLVASDVESAPGTGMIRVLVPPLTEAHTILALEGALREVVPLDIYVRVERQAGSSHNRHDRKREERAADFGGAATIAHPGYPIASWSRATPGAIEVFSRHAREASLVALVASVPAGLDANGWRAAVLAYVERTKTTVSREFWRDHRTIIMLDIERNDDNANARAYRRAVAPPGPRPKPERRKPAGLPVDVDW